MKNFFKGLNNFLLTILVTAVILGLGGCGIIGGWLCWLLN